MSHKVPRRRRRTKRKSLKIRTIKAALGEFLEAGASGDYGTNENVILSVMGAKGIHARDCATFDAVRDKYEVPKSCSFEEAFYACWDKYRDWSRFDFETLKDCHAEFRNFELPDRVLEAFMDEEIAEHYDFAMGEE